jgi:AbiV family abortive infection protein
MSELRRRLIKAVRTMDESSLDKLDSGALTDEQIAGGMHLSFKNAQELYEDALLLFKNERLGRTLSLLILALEELGRIPALVNAVLISRTDEHTWKKFWDGLRRHHLKQGVWTAYGRQLAESGHDDARYFKLLPLNQVALLDKFKQCGFYVTCFDGDFLTPNMFARFDKRKIDALFELVRDRIEGFRGLHASLQDSYRMVLQLREETSKWSEAQLRKEIEEILAEWNRPAKVTTRATVH